MFGGLTHSDFCANFSNVDFIWQYYGTRYPMKFLGGIIGVQPGDDGSVSAALGWAVRDDMISLSSLQKQDIQKGLEVFVGHDKIPGILEYGEFTEYGDLGEKNYRLVIDLVKIKTKDGIKEFDRWNLDKIYVNKIG